MAVKNPTYATIESVQFNLDQVKADNKTKEDLRKYFDHLSEEKENAGMEALWALIKDKDVPAAAAVKVAVNVQNPEEKKP